MSRHVAVLGQGYVGLPLALAAVDAGLSVTGVEVDPRRHEALLRGQSYLDDVPSERLVAALATGRYRPVDDCVHLSDIDVAVITVPTPLTCDDQPDLGQVLACLDALVPHLRPGVVVVLESTTYPGTTDELVAPMLAERTGLVVGRDLHIGFSPERIDPGNPTFTLGNTPKLVSGVTAACRSAVDEFYRSIGVLTVPVSGTREAEFAKLLENTFRLVNIALVNEVAEYAHRRGLDIWESVRAAGTKPFGFMQFVPGPGAGGHCIPIDPRYLSWESQRSVGLELGLVEHALGVNRRRPEVVVQVAVDELARRGLVPPDAHVLLVGLAYKKNVGDLRESPSLRVHALLTDAGARVTVVDPVIAAPAHGDVRVLRGIAEVELGDVDLAILVTDHDDIDYAALVAAGVPVVDTRNRLTGTSVVTI